MPRQWRRALAVALVLLVAGCATQDPPTPRPTPTPSPLSNGGGSSSAPVDGDPSASIEPTVGPTDYPPRPSPTATASPAPSDRPTTHVLDVWKTVPYATAGDCGERLTECQQFVDVYAPHDDGAWAVVVMAHGRPRTPADMVELARAVAAHGAVVFNIDYRGVRPVVQQGWPDAVEDVACAVRFARAKAHRYGGDASRLVLVGHSFGGYLGTLVSLAGDKFHGDCLTPDESALPDAWVGISANCLVGYPPPAVPLWTTWYGGTPSEIPRVWEKGDPLEHVGANSSLVVRMIHEEDDPLVSIAQPRELVHVLKKAGYDASLTVLDGDDHWGPLDMDEHAGKVTRDLILDLLRR